MKRDEILDTAKEAVTKDRQATHGRPEDTFGLIADLWNDFLATKLGGMREITAADVAMMLALLKIARFRQNPHHEDNFVDLAGYAACAGELASTPNPWPTYGTTTNSEGVLKTFSGGTISAEGH